MEYSTLQEIATRPAEIDVSFANVPLTYTGTRIPLHGIGSVNVSHNGITAEIDDVEHWEMQMLTSLPQGTLVPFGGLFRSTTPGKLVGPEGQGHIVPDSGGWTADGAFFVGQNSSFGPSAVPTKYKFAVESLSIQGGALGQAIAAVRRIYAGGAWNSAFAIGDRTVLVRSLSESENSIESETLGVTIEGTPNEVEAESSWLLCSLISGNRLGACVTEYYAEDGRLIERHHRRGNVGTMRHQFFRPFYTPFDADGMNAALTGLIARVHDDFPMDVIMNHMFQAATDTVDADAIHLVLAAHTAIEAWNRFFGFDAWIDDRIWKRISQRIRKQLIPEELYVDIGDDMRANLRSILPHANRTTTSWRQQRLYDALGIDVTGDEARRILKLRDELLHNGYFVKSWHDLSLEEAQIRRDDVERLRRLALFVVFRLIGYFGQYLDPVTLTPRIMPKQSEAIVAP
jgi:hypothetical protein